MLRPRFVAALVSALVLSAAAVAGADVRTDQKTKVKFENMPGLLSRMFVGKAMGDGVVSTVVVKGNRKATVDGDTGEIVDLDEEKIYSLDFKRKTYRVLTFEQFLRQMETRPHHGGGTSQHRESRIRARPHILSHRKTASLTTWVQSGSRGPLHGDFRRHYLLEMERA